MSRYIDTAEVAKLVRAELKKVFGRPARFFSVKIDRYSGGSSINISWTDGPTEGEAREKLSVFCGGRFEGMSDCSYAADQWYCPEHGAVTAEEYGGDTFCDTGVRKSRCCHKAELVHFANTSIQFNRRLSDEFTAQLTKKVADEYGFDAAKYSPNGYVSEADEFFGTLVYRESVKISL